MMAEAAVHEGGFSLRGGHLALDFANTADWHARPEPDELLVDYDRLLDWGRQVGTLTPEHTGVLRRIADERPAAAAAALDYAIAVREAIYRLFSALAAGRPLPETDLATLNAALAAAAAAVLARLRFTDLDLPAIEHLAAHRLGRGLRFLRRAHLDEGEPLALTGITVGDEVHGVDGTARAERLAQ